MWIHEHKNWINFTWDSEKLTPILADVSHTQGRLLGKIENIGFDLQQEANLSTLTSDVLKSSAIEGEYFKPEDVRSSVARRLGIEKGGLQLSLELEGIVDITMDATQNYDKPLSKERLCGWQATLFPTGRSGMYDITVGKWRTDKQGPMRVVSGRVGKERIHFEAPSAKRINNQMKKFLTWFNNGKDINPLLKAGIAHFWFEVIHPFDDGNGRVGRAIADMALARADGVKERFYSMSTQIESERKDYYRQLETQSRGTPDITGWLEWFLGCLGRSVLSAEKTLADVLLKAALWQKTNQQPVNERQQRIINRMLSPDWQGYINTGTYAKLAKCSTDTALRDIQELKRRRILIQNPSKGRSTSYRLNKKL